MSVPKVAIVGRPNVGKSSLFNWLAEKMIAITDAAAGITRDRLSYLMELDDRYFELIDTGGMGFEDPDNLSDQVEHQISYAIDTADLILFVVDSIAGKTPLDLDILERLRKTKKPMILVANKTDGQKLLPEADEFYQMGIHTLIKVSVKANRNKQELQRAILEHLPEDPFEELPSEDPIIKLAIVGRRNVGKSTFINTLAQEERMIVSEVAGTTRDSVDVLFSMDEKEFIAIDTPGLRKRKSVKQNVDYYGVHRAQRSIRRADVVFLFFDASVEIGRVEKQLASYILEQHKPCIFVVNKWDLYAGDLSTEEWGDYLQETFPTMWYFPIVFITGQTGQNVKNLVNHGQLLHTQARSRITTGEFNRLIQAALQRNPPPLSQSHHRPKVYYSTQVGTEPPTFVVFCNEPAWIGPTYRRYLESFLHDQLEFGEVPLKIYYRKRKHSDEYLEKHDQKATK